MFAISAKGVPSSTPPRSTGRTPMKNWSGGRKKVAATRWCWPRSSGWCRMPAADRVTLTAARPTSAQRWKGHCAVWAPTTSTCTTSIGSIPNTPIEDTIGALAELLTEGKVRPGADLRPVRADDQVPFPMPRDCAVLDLSWPSADHDLGRNVAVGPLAGTRTRNTQRTPSAQARDQLSPQGATPLDMKRPVDGLVRSAWIHHRGNRSAIGGRSALGSTPWPTAGLGAGLYCGPSTAGQPVRRRRRNTVQQAIPPHRHTTAEAASGRTPGNLAACSVGGCQATRPRTAPVLGVRCEDDRSAEPEP